MKDQSSKNQKLIIKKCDHCGKLLESAKELPQCPICKKAQLPCHYFEKIHTMRRENKIDLYSLAQDLEESKLLKG